MSLDDQHGIELTQVKFIWKTSERARKTTSSSMVSHVFVCFFFHSHQWSIVNVQNPNLIDVDLKSNDFYLQHYVHRTKRYPIDAFEIFIIILILLLATTYCRTRCAILYIEENSDDFIMSIGKSLNTRTHIISHCHDLQISIDWSVDLDYHLIIVHIFFFFLFLDYYYE